MLTKVINSGIIRGVKRFSDFARGDRVRLLRECRDICQGDRVFLAGEAGTLGVLYRVQDGREVWSVRLDRQEKLGTLEVTVGVRITVSHLDIGRET